VIWVRLARMMETRDPAVVGVDVVGVVGVEVEAVGVRVGADVAGSPPPEVVGVLVITCELVGAEVAGAGRAVGDPVVTCTVGLGVTAVGQVGVKVDLALQYAGESPQLFCFE